MKRVFADAVYWVALVQRNDQWHTGAVKAAQTLRGGRVVTTEYVFDEFLAYFSDSGPMLRDIAARTVEQALADPAVTVVTQSRQSFLDGLALYKARGDKGYSLTDCISMLVMRAENLTEVLTHDEHFSQEGFTKLL